MVSGVIGLVALVITVLAVLAGAGHAGYLALLTSAAKKRPGGQVAADYAKKRFPVAGASLGAAVLALLISTGGVGADVVAILLGGGSGIAAMKSLQTTQARLNKGEL